EVEDVDSESPQAGLALAPDRLGLQAVADLAMLVPNHAALGEHVRPLAHALEGAGDDLFGMPQAVDRGGIDPIDARIQRFVDRGQGVNVVLATPGELPAASADRPSPEADRSDEQVRISKLFGLHGCRLFQLRKHTICSVQVPSEHTSSKARLPPRDGLARARHW